ncbi:hypothetical protein [Adhaeribacter rhizoryzae]|uniref:STAS/SEC14 domain-containing protein n=1 Tax=Adhaeribacter rhizoryzae TaxID=2607907 RepID=A0A5M6DUR7_9BACT|nr:hypothetical protein [Adhaeribacter rhizoryzae]KAA5549195.1 hypothetical protein F0145_00960 [Adhaeribacter rhizoryzae]
MEQLIFAENHIQVYYNPQEEWLYVKWLGLQTNTSVMAGFEKVLEYLKAHQCTKVLNNSLLMDGIWSAAARWVANNWFPRLHAAGPIWFVWIYAPDGLSQLSITKTLSLMAPENIKFIKIFHELPSAQQWLRTI